MTTREGERTSMPGEEERGGDERGRREDMFEDVAAKDGCCGCCRCFCCCRGANEEVVVCSMSRNASTVSSN